MTVTPHSVLFIIFSIIIAYILFANFFYLYNWMQPNNKIEQNIKAWEKGERKRLQK